MTLQKLRVQAIQFRHNLLDRGSRNEIKHHRCVAKLKVQVNERHVLLRLMSKRNTKVGRYC